MTQLSNAQQLAAIFLLSVLALIPSFAHAEGFVSLVGIEGVNAVGSGGMQGYINTFYRIAIIAASLIAVIKLIYAGAQYVLSGIVTDKENAKKDIETALIGLLIIIGAVTILRQINPDIANLPALEPVAYTPIVTPPPPPPTDALSVAEFRSQCESKASEGYEYKIYKGNWEKPIDGVDCCIPGSTGASKCKRETVSDVGGVKVDAGRTYSWTEYDALIKALRDAGNTVREGELTFTLEDRAKQDCDNSNGTYYTVQRERNSTGSTPGLNDPTRYICVTQ